MHRGQYSTVNQLTFGRMLSPHRGQFRNADLRSIIASPGQLESGSGATPLERDLPDSKAIEGHAHGQGAH